MKIKNGFIIRKIVDVNVVVPVGETSVDFNGIITLNDTGAFLFKQLMSETNKDSLLKALMDEYEIDETSALTDINMFCDHLEEAKLIA